MDALRYYLVPVMTMTGIAGFVLGGPFVWLGFGTFPVLMMLDIALPNDSKMRALGISSVADLAIYLQLPLMIALYLVFAHSVNSGTNPILGDAASGGRSPDRSPALHGFLRFRPCPSRTS